MEESIVSIYDLLLKRQRQLRLENMTVVGVADESPIVEKGAKVNVINRTKVNQEIKKRTSQMGANVISASHLTRKHTGLVMPTSHKRDVIDKLVARMTGGSKETAKAPSTPEVVESIVIEPGVTPSCGPAAQNVETVSVPTKKVKASSKPKVKNAAKVVPDNGTKSTRRRMALSPRNDLSNISTSKLDRNTRNWTANINLPIDIYQNSIRSKRSLKTRKSKTVVKSKLDRISSDELNTVLYRL